MRHEFGWLKVPKWVKKLRATKGDVLPRYSNNNNNMPTSSISGNGNLQEQAMRSPSPSKIREAFEAKASNAKNGALLVAGLHVLSRFFGFCALTWATVVLLGGFPSNLRTLDFFLISTLLLLEGARLFIVQIFSKILSKTLFRESHSPEEFEFKDMQYMKANRLDMVGQGVSAIFAFASLICTVARFSLTNSHALSGNGSIESKNLRYALYTFYVLVMGNSILAILSAILRPLLRRRCDAQPPENCLMCFHDEVYKTAMNERSLKADQLDILDFAYTKLASDYKRNIRAPLIKAQNKSLISYLYHNQQGIAMNCEYLSSSDVWKQLAAANLPGFWAEEPRIESQVAMFWALRKRIYGAGKDAESALNSIECLGKRWEKITESKPYPFLINDLASTTNIVDTLVHLLLEPIRPTLLFQLRAFEACCRNAQVLKHIYGDCTTEKAQELCQQLQRMIERKQQQEFSVGQLQKLCSKLFTHVSEKGLWMTTKIYAANALLSLLCYGARELSVGAMKSLQGPVEEFINPAEACKDGDKKPYFWVDDMILVEKIRMKLHLPRYEHWAKVRIRSPDDGAELSFEKALCLIEKALCPIEDK